MKESSSSSSLRLLISLWVTSSLSLCPELTDAPCHYYGGSPPPSPIWRPHPQGPHTLPSQGTRHIQCVLYILLIYIHSFRFLPFLIPSSSSALFSSLSFPFRRPSSFLFLSSFFLFFFSLNCHFFPPPYSFLPSLSSPSSLTARSSFLYCSFSFLFLHKSSFQPPFCLLSPFSVISLSFSFSFSRSPFLHIYVHLHHPASLFIYLSTFLRSSSYSFLIPPASSTSCLT